MSNDIREKAIRECQRFLMHCGFDPKDVYFLQDLEDYIRCLSKQADDYLYELTITRNRLGWSLTAKSYSYDKVQTAEDVLIEVKNEATLFKGIYKLAYRVARDWNCILTDNIISYMAYVEKLHKVRS